MTRTKIAFMVGALASRALCQHSLPPPMTELTGMTNIGKVLLPAGVPAQYSGAFDPTSGFGYFGATSALDPSILSMVNLNGPLPTVVQDGRPNSIPKGVINILALAVDSSDPDPSKHYVYGCAASGHLLKFFPGDATHTPQLISILKPKSVDGTIITGVIDTTSPDPAEHYGYYAVVGRHAPNILRVRLSDLSEQGFETLSMQTLRFSAVDTKRHYAYFTSFAGEKTKPQIAKVNLAKFHDGGTESAVYSMDSTKPGDGIARERNDFPWFDEGLVLDTVHNYAYIGTYNPTPAGPKLDTWPYNQAMVVRVKLGEGDGFPAHPISTLNLRLEERNLGAGVFDPSRGNVYFGTDNTYPARIYMIHVGDGTKPMREVGRLDLHSGSQANNPRDGDNTKPRVSVELNGEVHIRSGFLDARHQAIYFGTDSRPGQVIKIGINGKRQFAERPSSN